MNINKPIFVMPHYIATPELEELATQAITSMKATADVFIVSVDDGSPMNTDFLKGISDKVIRLKKNSGFAIACNTGLEWALKQETHYIGCVNNDIEAFDGWLEALIEPFDKWPNTGITGVIHDSWKEKAIEKNGTGTTITQGGLIGDRMQNGGLWLSTKNVLLKVSLGYKVFDERFVVGGEEDVDLFLRIRDHLKLPIIMSDKAVIWHKEGATRWNDQVEPGFAQKNRSLEHGNHDRFAQKWDWDIRERGLDFYEDILEN